MTTIQADLLSRLSPDSQEKLCQLVARCQSNNWEYLQVVFPSLPRRFRGGKKPGNPVCLGKTLLDPGTWSESDIAATLLLMSEDSPLYKSENDGTAYVWELYRAGDALERHMILKALPYLDLKPLSISLIIEAHRTNDQSLFEAAFCDTNYPALVLGEDDYNNAALKAAFIGIDPSRIWGIETRATSTLSQMLLDLREEREAASRPPWAGTLEVMAHAPLPKLGELIRSDIDSPDDLRAQSAARAACVLHDESLHDAIRSRLARTTNPDLLAVLKAAL